MENRFGFKDLVTTVLLTAILVSIWLAMKQFDRQWNDLRSLRTDINSLTNTQNRILSRLDHVQRALAEGAVLSHGTGQAAWDEDEPMDSFHRLREAREQEDFAEGDVIVDAFGTRIKTVTALTYKDLYGRRIQSYVLESLAVQDGDTLEWLPHIARSWQIEDNSEAYDAYLAQRTAELSARADADAQVYAKVRQQMVDDLSRAGQSVPADGTPEAEALDERARQTWISDQVRLDTDRPPASMITFRLRENVVFSDGRPLTAHDVVYTWELLNNPLIDAPETRNFYDNVEHYRALDDYTVEFRMREPHYLAFSMVAAFPVLPKHFYSRFTVDDINRRPGLLMGSGPYRMEDPESWAPGRRMRLVRNENYWGPRSAAATLVWLEIEEDVPRLTAFKNGDIDVFAPTPEQYVELKSDPRVLEQHEPHEYRTLPTGYSFIAWNQFRNDRPTIFADRRVRQAMTYLIDRQRIAQEVLMGFAFPTSGPFDEQSPQADPELEPYPYNRQKALALLAECGWTPGRDGVLRNEKGEPFAFTLTYPSGNEQYERTMLMVKDTLNRAGVLMTQDPQEWSVFIERLDARAFDACALAWGGGAIEGDIRQMFHSSQIAGGANNFTHYRNPELDRLIDQARRTIDEDERMKLWQACHRIVYEDQPYTFMHRRMSLVFIDRRLHNVQRIRTGLNDRTEWYVPMPLQRRTP